MRRLIVALVLVLGAMFVAQPADAYVAHWHHGCHTIHQFGKLGGGKFTVCHTLDWRATPNGQLGMALRITASNCSFLERTRPFGDVNYWQRNHGHIWLDFNCRQTKSMSVWSSGRSVCVWISARLRLQWAPDQTTHWRYRIWRNGSVTPC